MAKKNKPKYKKDQLRIERESKKKDNIKTILLTLFTVALTKGGDLLFPSRISIREVPVEHMVIEHSFDFGMAEDDSLLALRLDNIMKLEQIEAKIDAKGKETLSNEPLLDNLCPNAKGYTLANSSPYCTIELNQSNNGYIESELLFFDKQIVDKISFVGIKVFREKDDGSNVFVLDVNYYPKVVNIMRLANTFAKGIYRFEIGFTFKKDINEEYPSFYRQSRIISLL